MTQKSLYVFPKLVTVIRAMRLSRSKGSSCAWASTLPQVYGFPREDWTRFWLDWWEKSHPHSMWLLYTRQCNWQWQRHTMSLVVYLTHHFPPLFCSSGWLKALERRRNILCRQTKPQINKERKPFSYLSGGRGASTCTSPLGTTN